MKNSAQKKAQLFSLFSRNLEWVKELPAVSFKQDFTNGYLCPLCLEVFFEKHLDTSMTNHLTLEDIPPKSLGGKPLALTCKNCNSRGGHELDVHLLNSLLKMDTMSFLPHSKGKMTLELNENKVNGEFSIDADGKATFDIHTKRSNPTQEKQFMRDFIPPRTIYHPLLNPDKMFDAGFKSPTFKMKFKWDPNERRAEIALLRVAYLIAFATFGNGFLINNGLKKVREQILNPDKVILAKVFWIKYEFPKELEGINIITLPKELRCFLVIFSLKTKSSTRQFAIALPGPGEPSLEVYDFIENKLCTGDGTTFSDVMFERIPNENYLSEKKYTFASHVYWQEYTKEDYKPRLRPS